MEINFNNQTIKNLGTVEEPIYRADEIGKALGAKNILVTLRNFKGADILTDEQRRERNIVTHQKYRKNIKVNNKIVLLTQRGVKHLLCVSRSQLASDLAKALGIDVYTRFEPIESETLSKILKVFQRHRYELQKQVGNYRIDLYFPDARLAIECDERGHKGRDGAYETERQSYIEKELMCSFIRYDPDSDDFDIFKVVGDIHDVMCARA